MLPPSPARVARVGTYQGRERVVESRAPLTAVKIKPALRSTGRHRTGRAPAPPATHREDRPSLQPGHCFLFTGFMVSFFWFCSIEYKITTAACGAFPLRHAGERGSGKWPEKGAGGPPGHRRARGGTVGKVACNKEKFSLRWYKAGTQERMPAQSPGPLPASSRVVTGPGRQQVHSKSIQEWTCYGLGLFFSILGNANQNTAYGPYQQDLRQRHHCQRDLLRTAWKALCPQPARPGTANHGHQRRCQPLWPGQNGIAVVATVPRRPYF